MRETAGMRGCGDACLRRLKELFAKSSLRILKTFTELFLWWLDIVYRQTVGAGGNILGPPPKILSRKSIFDEGKKDFLGLEKSTVVSDAVRPYGENKNRPRSRLGKNKEVKQWLN